MEQNERKPNTKNVFDEYNKSGEVPANGFTSEQLKSHPKAIAIRKMIGLVENDILKDAAHVFDDFNVKFKYSSSDNKNFGESAINAMAFKFDGSEKQDLTVSVNFNFAKLGQLADVELYSAVYKTMYDSLMKKRELSSNGNEYKFGKQDELHENEPAINDENFDREGNYVEYPQSILSYIVKFLKEFFGYEQDASGLDAKAIANFNPNEAYFKCAKRITTNLENGGIAPQDIFDNPAGKNLVAERCAKIAKVSNSQQASHLIGVFSQKEFNALKSNNPQEIKSFCEKYARSILSQSNIDANAVQITFRPTGAIGSYLDYGNKQEVNININEIMKKNNPAEVVMTIQHELTHAIDSTANKGVEVGQNDYGLVDNLVGGTKVSELNENDVVKDEKGENFTKVTSFVKELKEVCYRINPNERSARQGELAAIEFMQGLHTDADMQRCIKTSIDSYNRYQTKVLAAVEKAPTMRTEFENAIKGIVKDGSATAREIDTMLDYIEKINAKYAGKFDEKQAIELANKMKEAGAEQEQTQLE